MFLFYLFLYGFGCIFLLFVIIALTIGEIYVEKSIRKELEKYGYHLISVKSTRKRFRFKESPTPFWRKHLSLGYSPATATVHYKEVIFRNDGDKVFENVVAIEKAPFSSVKLYFEVRLEEIGNL